MALNSMSQDPTFLNANQSLLYLNPSFAGSNGGVRNQFSYRNQWPQLSLNMQTFLNTTDVYFQRIKAGIAISLFQDNLLNGKLKTNVLSLSYGQYLSFRQGDLKIIPSIKLAYAERLLDIKNLTFDETFDARCGFVWNFPPILLSRRTYYDLSSGLLVNYKNKFYAGASILHINQPNQALDFSNCKLPYALNVHASYTGKLTEKSILQVLGMFNRQNKFNTLRVGLNTITFNHLILGLSIGNFSSAVFNAGYRSNYFSLLFGYDVTFSKLAGNTAGAFELHASFNLRNKEQRKVLTSFESQ